MIGKVSQYNEKPRLESVSSRLVLYFKPVNALSIFILNLNSIAVFLAFKT